MLTLNYKCTIVICPLLQGRIPAICTNVTTVTTPGESVDIVVTDYGVAVNPKNADLMLRLKDAGLPVIDIHELKEIAERITGTPAPAPRGGRTVANIIYRDGTQIDTIQSV